MRSEVLFSKSQSVNSNDVENRIFHILLDQISIHRKRRVIAETTTKIPEVKTQKQSEKLPDVPSAAHVWPRGPRTDGFDLKLVKVTSSFVDPWFCD